ncbi:MAG: ABC transporter permease [Endomicrobiales bacterium]|nr:ABC transporter permease [Endomicrobiales bacterium]
MKNKLALLGALCIVILILLGAFAPLIAPKRPDEQNITERIKAPSSKHILGTDDLGRDVLSRMLYSARISLSVGIVAVLIAITLGTLIGMLSGYFGGVTDSILMRFVDVMLCFPTFFLLLMVLAFLEPSILNVIIVIGLTAWPGLARIVRAEVLSIKQRDFINASKLLATSKTRIFLMHILPNVIGPILVAATLGVGDAILAESGLSFLGLGVQPPDASWGQILSAGKEYIHIAWWLSVFPGVAILITVLSFNLLGEGIREKLNPKK